MTKEEIRAAMRQRRAALTPAALEAASRAVCANLAGLRELASCVEIAAYLSLPRELALAAFLEACHARGARLSVPAWDAARGCYRFARLRPGAALIAGPLKVAEPAAQQPVAPATLEAVLLPGLAFDRQGGRLGYGGGHYDRLLAACAPTAIRIGVAWTWQVLDAALPLQAHDARVDLLITEGGVWRCATRRASA